MTDQQTACSFPFHVSEATKEWYGSLGQEIKSSLQRLKDAFLERFKKTNVEYSLNNIKQETTESTDDYIRRMRNIPRDSGVPENVLVGMMVGGLRPDVMAIVMPQLPKTIQHFRSASTIAEKTIAMTSNKPLAALSAFITCDLSLI